MERKREVFPFVIFLVWAVLMVLAVTDLQSRVRQLQQQLADTHGVRP